MNEYLTIILPSLLSVIIAIIGWIIKGITSDIKEVKNKISEVQTDLNTHKNDNIGIQKTLEVEVETIFKNLDKVDHKLDRILEK